MKIAVIRQKYVNYGGAENFVADYTTQMADAGHEIHIFANRWTPSDHPNIRLHPVGAIKISSYIRSLSFAWFAARAVRREKFDIIQSHERTFHQDVYRAGDGCHKEWLEQRKKYLSPWKRFLLGISPFHRLILALEKGLFETNRCRKIIAISQQVKKDIRKHYRVPDGKIDVVYNGVRLDKFTPDHRASCRKAVRERIHVPENSVMILFVGSGFERKGLKFLIQSLGDLSREDWRLVLMGKGDWNPYLSLAPRGTRGKIICLDPVDDIERYYAAADIFVLPSIYEPFGNANLEALASGLPSVISGRSGAAEIVRHKHNAMVVEDPTDPKAIAESINTLFDPAIRETMGRNARLLAQEFSPQKNMEQMIRLYKEIADCG